MENLKKLYLDDIRNPVNDNYIIVRSYHEAVQYIKNNNIPNYISFAHDLGINED